MSDWQVGDLALCVDNTPRSYTVPGALMPEVGRVYTVEALCLVSPTRLYLAFGKQLPRPQGIKRGLGFASDRFRKIRPDEQEACEPEFVTLIKRAKRKVTA